MARKIWVTGDQILAADLNGNFYFGGTGADGALAISSGTTTVNLASSAFVVLNYTTFSITGTGKLAFSNPHANGTLIVIRVRGNMTLTSSSTPMLDFSGLGGAGGTPGVTGGTGSGGGSGQTGNYILGGGGGGGGGGGNTTDLTSPSFNTGGGAGAALTATDISFQYGISSYAINVARSMRLACGSGGGGGGYGMSGDTAGTGGNGGGAALIECGGAWNFTTASGISISGKNGTSATAGGVTASSGDGGGGSCGMLLVLYNTLTANSGTITATGGNGGPGATKTGTSGGHGPNGGAGGGGGGGRGTGGAGGNGSFGGAFAGNNGTTGGGGGGGGGYSMNIAGTSTPGTGAADSSAYLVTQNIWLT